MTIRSSLLSFAFLASTLPARAQDPAARDLFEEGRELAAEGEYRAACPKFEQSFKLHAGLGTQFNLADCWEHVGRLASARSLFLAAADAAQAAGQADRERVLRQRAEALSARVSKLLIEVEPTSARLTLTRNDEPIQPDAWGKPLPVDAGSYAVVATAPGRRPWRTWVEVKDDGSVISVLVPDLSPSEAEVSAILVPAKARPANRPGATPVPKPTAGKPAVVPLSRDAAQRGSPRQLTLPVLGLTGLGAGALAFSAVMSFRYKSAHEGAQAICPTSRDCSSREIAEHERLVDRSSTARTLGFVGLGIGAASLGGAAALYLLQPRRRASPVALEALPIASADGSFGVGLSGSF